MLLHISHVKDLGEITLATQLWMRSTPRLYCY